MEAILIVLAAAFVVSLLPVLYLVIRAYLRYRGQKLVLCPQTKTPAAVRVEPLRAALSGVLSGDPDLNLTSCSFGPDHPECAAQCLEQVAAPPRQFSRSKAS